MIDLILTYLKEVPVVTIQSRWSPLVQSLSRHLPKLGSYPMCVHLIGIQILPANGANVLRVCPVFGYSCLAHGGL